MLCIYVGDDMFIKTSIRKKPNGQQYETHYLTEGYRDKKTGRVKHRYLSNLSPLPSHCILSLKTALKNGNGEIDKLDLSELEVLCNKEYGSVKVFHQLYQKYFGNYLTHSNYNKALESCVINKIFNPKSKNSLKNWLSKVDLGYEISNKNDLYESLDYLEQEQPEIEKRLSKAIKQNGCNVLLYDITSTYFEGKGDESICAFGYSRDHRSDRVQVNIGVITSSDGTPISVEIIAGNISDKQTLQDQIDKLKDKFNITEITFVFDRGMKSTVNLEYLQESGYNYVTALTHSELRKQCNKNQNIQASLFDKKDLSTFEIDGKYYSLVHNPIKADSDKNNRRKLISKTIEKLEAITKFKRKYEPMVLQDKVSAVINKYNCKKFINYEIKSLTSEAKSSKEAHTKSNVPPKNVPNNTAKANNYGKLEFCIAEDKVLQAERYDGFYMIESSNKDIQAQTAVSQYKDLQLVERSFDAVKNHIEIRPVFHYKASRIKGHIMTCFMSYFLLHKFKQECADLLKEYSLDELLTELTKIQKNYLKIKNFCFEKITNLSDLGSNLMKRFSIPLLCPE